MYVLNSIIVQMKYYHMLSCWMGPGRFWNVGGLF